MSSTVLPVVLGIGVAAGTGIAICVVRSVRAGPTVASGAPAGLLPEALPRANLQLVACNPCAASNPCNPCAAASPCNPCAAANPCNPCSPCAAGAAAGATECTVPRLQTAAANPCNPCATANPCNPCNPCATANPCAAAAPCSPCNPCAAAGAVELTDAEAATVHDCIIEYQQAAYAASDNPLAQDFWDWTAFSRLPYVSATHGNRYVMNYSNEPSYGDFEAAGEMPAGATMAKSSFVVGPSGQVAVGPLFLMEKIDGFDPDTHDWRYTMIMPDGSTFGVTGGKNASGMEFCNACHAVVAEAQDALYFLPEAYRVR